MRTNSDGQNIMVGDHDDSEQCHRSSSYSDYNESDRRRAREAERHLLQAQESLRLALHHLHDEKEFKHETHVITTVDTDIAAVRGALRLVGGL